MWFPSHVILYCWLNGTSCPGSSLSWNWIFTDCTVKWPWLHPEQQHIQNFPQSHVQVSITPPRSLSEDVRSSKQWCNMVKFCLWAMCPRIAQLCSATAQAGQRNPFSNWCTLVKPSALSYIPLRLKLSSVCKQVSLPIGFTLPQKVWLTLFYRILSFVLVEWSLIYITNCKTKMTKYNKNIFLQSSMIIIHIIVLSKGLSTALSVKAMPNSANLI